MKSLPSDHISKITLLKKDGKEIVIPADALPISTNTVPPKVGKNIPPVDQAKKTDSEKCEKKRVYTEYDIAAISSKIKKYHNEIPIDRKETPLEYCARKAKEAILKRDAILLELDSIEDKHSNLFESRTQALVRIEEKMIEAFRNFETEFAFVQYREFSKSQKPKFKQNKKKKSAKMNKSVDDSVLSIVTKRHKRI